ncbi:hypothetical protein KOW79_022125 [Hemibagrus wyckioides]|uniref:Uncharacterized protein n=1 Tax=Hemibagrus wyckioides TaxID=337641 RepID=A0A9D3N5K9_9TELE|nr:hypothetical protein KOW79_022125 [Hemibagrus wyckioides]
MRDKKTKRRHRCATRREKRACAVTTSPMRRLRVKRQNGRGVLLAGGGARMEASLIDVWSFDVPGNRLSLAAALFLRSREGRRIFSAQRRLDSIQVAKVVFALATALEQT